MELVKICLIVQPMLTTAEKTPHPAIFINFSSLGPPVAISVPDLDSGPNLALKSELLVYYIITPPNSPRTEIGKYCDLSTFKGPKPQFWPISRLFRDSCVHPLTEKGQIWQDKVDPRSTLTCQISSILYRLRDEKPSLALFSTSTLRDGAT